MDAADYMKSSPGAPAGFFEAEARGLTWLAEAGGARVVQVRSVSPTALRLELLHGVRPTAGAAREFGAALAVTHDAGTDGWGTGPPGLRTGYFGPLSDPIAQAYGNWDSWGEFYAEARVRPWVELAVRPGGLESARPFAPVLDRLRVGEFDDDDVPARLHGDLWSGNLMWTERGAVLIDPSAHGGHRENDLALLALFGCPYLSDVLDGYQQVHPLRPGWRRRTELHQLHAVVAHAALFGGGYGRQALAIAHRYG